MKLPVWLKSVIATAIIMAAFAVVGYFFSDIYSHFAVISSQMQILDQRIDDINSKNSARDVEIKSLQQQQTAVWQAIRRNR